MYWFLDDSVRRRLPLWGVLLFGLFVPAFAGELRSQDGRSEIEGLIQQLGASDYRLRQEAEERLLERGLSSLDAVRAAMELPNAEVRYRSERLLARLQALAAAENEERLLTDPWQVNAEIYVIWERWQGMVGDTPASRKLLVAMMRKEPELLLSLNSSRAVWRNQFEKRCGELRVFPNPQGAEMNPMTTAALLFVLLQPETQPSSVAAGIVSSATVTGHFDRLLDDPTVGTASTALLELWLRQDGLATPHLRLNMGLKIGSSAAMSAARQLLKEGQNNRQLSHQAVMYIAKVVGDEGLEDLEAKLHDRTPIYTNRQRGSDHQNVVTMSDLALLALLHITKQAPARYGFTHLVANPLYLYQLDSCGLPDDDARDKAVQRWEAWRREHLRSVMPPPVDASEGDLM